MSLLGGAQLIIADLGFMDVQDRWDTRAIYRCRGTDYQLNLSVCRASFRRNGWMPNDRGGIWLEHPLNDQSLNDSVYMEFFLSHLSMAHI